MPVIRVLRPWQRFLRLNVRGLIVVVLVTGGWLGWLVRCVGIQREAVQAITAAGGRVSYAWESRSHRQVFLFHSRANELGESPCGWELSGLLV